MLDWSYDHKDYLEGGFKPITPGKYRVRIETAEELLSKTTLKPMVKLKLKVSGQSGCVWHYLVLDKDNKERTNKNLGDIYESFGIPQGEMNTQSWVGRVGGAMLKQDTYNDQPQTKVAFLLTRKQQEELPPWQEKPLAPVNSDMMSFDGDNPNNVPF